ncbi:MAG: GAF domain-containing protein [Desulfobacterales bacterium]|nr:GAF domain-containing protein [Desulfobacterales bacterium]
MNDTPNSDKERLVRAYRLLSSCNEAVVQATNETQLMQEICRLLVDAGGYRMAWIGSAEKDCSKRVRPVVSAGFEKGYLDAIHITWDDSERGKGPTGTAIRTGRPVICQNMLTDPNYLFWREQATRQGYASSIALPLLWKQSPCGALNVYATEPEAFGPREVELLTSLANNLTHGIISLWSSKALRESEARLSAVLEQLPVGVGVLDREGRFILINSALQSFAPQMMMPSRDPEQSGRWEAFDSQGRRLTPQHWPGERALRGEKVTPGEEFLYTGEDGRKLWTLISSVPFLSEKDGIIGAITVVKDITAQKKAESDLRRHAAILEGINQILYQTLTCSNEEELGSACLGIAERVTSSQFGFLGEITDEGRLNDIAISDSGWSACNMPESAGHKMPPKGLSLHGLYGRVLETGISFYTNTPTEHPDSIGLPEGHPPLHAFLGVPLIHAGRTIGLVAVANRNGGYGDGDLEALQALAPTMVQALLSKRADNDLAFQRELLQAIFDNIPVLLVLWDARLQRFRLNRYTETVLGWSTEDANDGDFMSKVYPDPDYRKQVASYMLSLGSGWKEWQVATKDGNSVAIDWANARLSGETMIGIGVDLRERKQMEIALKKNQQKLSEKLRELQNNNEELSEYAYIISHDLKAPLRAVRNYADFLVEDLEGRLDEEQKSYLSGIKKATAEGQQMILDLLAFSRTGESLEAPEKIDLSDLVQEVCEALMIPEDVQLSVRSGCPTLVAERTLLKQIMMNLVANGIKFNDAAVKKIEIWCRRNLENQIEVLVKDNGIGIEQRYFDQIFHVFQRLHPAASYEGTGIGLSIVKKAAAALGGSVRFESSPGKGSTFILTLPEIVHQSIGS